MVKHHADTKCSTDTVNHWFLVEDVLDDDAVRDELLALLGL